MSALTTGALLELRGLRTWFPIRTGIFKRITGHVKAVDGVDLTIFPGETLALVGESGCGKTTVGRTILQLVEASGGNIWFDGVNLSLLSNADFLRYRQKMQIVMQDPGSALDPRFTVRDAIAEGMEAFGIGANHEERTERVADLMRKVSLDPATMWRYPHEFSGGQRQRICIARALAVNPALLICDEATSALDVSIQAQILNLLADLQAERNLTYLFITHDLGVVRYFATRVAVMYLGRIVEVGPTERIFAAPRHPYTKALLASIPSLDPARRSVRPAALGDVPSPDNPPTGCHYHPRCAVRLPVCSREDPPVVEFADGMSRCVLARETSPRSSLSRRRLPPAGSSRPRVDAKFVLCLGCVRAWTGRRGTDAQALHSYRRYLLADCDLGLHCSAGIKLAPTKFRIAFSTRTSICRCEPAAKPSNATIRRRGPISIVVGPLWTRANRIKPSPMRRRRSKSIHNSSWPILIAPPPS